MSRHLHENVHFEVLPSPSRSVWNLGEETSEISTAIKIFRPDPLLSDKPLRCFDISFLRRCYKSWRKKIHPKKSGQQSNKGLSEIGPKEVNIWQKCLTYLKWEEFTQIVSASKSQARSSQENKSFLQSSCFFDQKQWQGHHIVRKAISASIIRYLGPLTWGG